MPRTRPDARLDELVRAATDVFIEHGYRRAQMSDVAEEVGVAKGTIYLYVESKEALFDLVLRRADRPEGSTSVPELPIPTPEPDATVGLVKERLAREARFPALEAALERRRVTDAGAELEAVVAELYDVLTRNRTGIKLVDRCAADFPEMARAFRRISREGIPERLERYLRERAGTGHFRAVGDPAVAARMVMELAVFWAVHVHWDPAPVEYERGAVRDTVVRFTKGALLR